MNKKIYVVTSGSYSDYHIDGIFDDKGLAQSFIDSFDIRDSWDKMSIEEWDLNGGGYKKGLKFYFVRFKPNSSDVENVNLDLDPDNEICFGIDIGGGFYIKVWGKDEKHAIKVANEKRAMYLANNQ